MTTMKLNNTLRFSNTAKAQIAILCCLLMAMLIAITTVTAHAYNKEACDITKNGVVDVADAVIYLRYVTEDETLDTSKYQAYDLNGDSVCNISDVIYIMRVLAGYDADASETTSTVTTTTVTTTETTETTTKRSIPWKHTTSETTTTTYGGSADTFFTEVVAIQMPQKEDKPVYAYKDNAGTVWFFTINGDDSQYQLLVDPKKITKVDRWEPTTEELEGYLEKFAKVPDFSDPMPEKEDFILPGARVCLYDLTPWSNITPELFGRCIRYLMRNGKNGLNQVTAYDYDQNAVINPEDAVIMIRYYAIHLGMGDF